MHTSNYLRTFASSNKNNNNLRAAADSINTGDKGMNTHAATTNRKSFIRKAYNAISSITSKKYFDSSWLGVKAVIEAILDTDKHVTLYLENARYEGMIGQEGHRKVYRYTIAGCEKDIDMQIVASFCGTIHDPMSAYDLTVMMN